MNKQLHPFAHILVLLSLILIAFCERPLQMHELNVPVLTKDLHLEGNLRTHDAFSSSSGNSIGGAIFGFLFGPILFFMAFICIWFNEKRAVIDYRRLKLAE